MKRKLLTIVSLSLCLALLSSAWAQSMPTKMIYEYHPMASLALGVGFSPNDPSAIKKICSPISINPRAPQLIESKISTTLVSTTRELKRTLGVDTSMEAKFLGLASAKSTTSYREEYQLNSNSIAIVFQAKAAYTTRRVDDVPLHPQFQKLIDEGKMTEFEKECGSHLVIGEDPGISINLVVQMDGVTAEEKRSLGLSGDGSLSLAKVGGSMSAKIESMASSKQDEKRLSLYAVVVGGEGLPSLADLITSFKELSEFKTGALYDALGKTMTKLDKSTAMPLRFRVAEYGHGFKPSHQDLNSEERDARLLEIVETYRREVQNSAWAKKAIVPFSPESEQIHTEIDPKLVQWVNEDLERVSDYVRALRLTHQKCLTDTSAELNACEIPLRPEVDSYDTLIVMRNT